jgi:E3 ubiquitin-protein ligase BIG BROTHER-like protein
MADVGTAGDEESLALALRLQAEEESRYGEYDDDDGEPDDPELDASLRLAMQLQQEDDDAQLRAVLLGAAGAGATDDGRPLSPSQLDYEQLIRLGENVGHVCRGASQESVDALLVLTHAECLRRGGDVVLGEECSICRMPFEPADELRVLRCRHAEHKECIDQWLKQSKMCCVCNTEIGTES